LLTLLVLNPWNVQGGDFGDLELLIIGEKDGFGGLQLIDDRLGVDCESRSEEGGGDGDPFFGDGGLTLEESCCSSFEGGELPRKMSSTIIISCVGVLGIVIVSFDLSVDLSSSESRLPLLKLLFPNSSFFLL